MQGLRKIGDLGRVTVFGDFVGTLAGLAAVWLQGENGLIWFILVQPLAGVLIALHYTRRLPKPTAVRLSLFETWNVWKPMAKLGAAFMLGGLATAATLLLVRGHISQELGLDAAGYFAAAWGITMTYVGFLLGAMGADYYPRLTEVIHDKVAAVQLMNDQAQLGLAISGPGLVAADRSGTLGYHPSLFGEIRPRSNAPSVADGWKRVQNCKLGTRLFDRRRGKSQDVFLRRAEL